MSKIAKLALEDTEDVQLANSGDEVEGNIGMIKVKESEKGNMYLSVPIEPKDEELDTIFDIVMLPMEDDSPRDQRRARRNLKKFCDAADIEPEELEEAIETDNFESLKGKSVTIVVDVDDYKGMQKNTVKNYVIEA